jgi:uncharacterized alpha-E superfamily protein
MLSRIASALYWMSRYLERVDNTARVIDINRTHMLEAEDAIPEDDQWRPLLGIFGSEEAYPRAAGGAAITARQVVRFLTQEPANPGSLHASLRLARENARVARDRISRPMWEVMNELWLLADARLRRALLPDEADDFLGRVRKEVARFHGLTVSTMMRGEAFGFYLLGTFLERADMTARILDVKYHLVLPHVGMVGSALDYYQWAALLRTLSGFEAYRRRHQTEILPLTVVELIVLEPAFPRSLRFSVERMAQALRQIGDPGSEGRTRGAMAELQDLIERTTAERIFASGPHEFLGRVLRGIAAVNEAVGEDYLEATVRDHACVI